MAHLEERAQTSPSGRCKPTSESRALLIEIGSRGHAPPPASRIVVSSGISRLTPLKGGVVWKDAENRKDAHTTESMLITDPATFSAR